MATRAAAKPRTDRRAASTLLIATRKGLWTLHARRDAPQLEARRPAFPRPHRPPRGRSTRATAGRCSPPRAPATSGRRSFARPTAAARGRRRRARRRSQPGSGRIVDHTFWLTPGHASRARRLVRRARRRRDCSAPPTAARRGTGVAGFNEHPQRKAWCGGDQDGTPDGAKLHSILVDPRDPRHLYIGMSSGGVFESTDGGADWQPLNHGVRADFQPDPDPEYGHDPHCVRLHPALPDRLYQQNHCGIYRLDRPAERWADIGAAMPKSVGSIGFPMVLHPRDPDTLWVFPMDGTSVWPRISPRRQAGRLPLGQRRRRRGSGRRRACRRAQAWWTVKRQAMTADRATTVGRLLRHDERRGLGQPRRRPDLEVPRRAPAAHLRGRSGLRSRLPPLAAAPAAVVVRIPGLLRSYTDGAATVALRRPPRAGDARRRARRARPRASPASASASSTSRARCGRTSRSSSTGRSSRDLATPLPPAADLMIVGALSGG